MTDEVAAAASLEKTPEELREERAILDRAQIADKPLDQLASAERALDAGAPDRGDPVAAGPEASPQITPEQAERDAAAKIESDRIAAEAAEQARVEAEAQAKREAEEAAAKEEADRQIERENVEAAQAEADRKAAEAKAEQDAKSAGSHLADPPREIPAGERLRAFEDEHVGKDAVRIGGRIERGSGSPFAAMSDEKKRQYAALEKLAAAEQKLADAHAALVEAEADHEDALAAAEPKPNGE